VPPLNAMRLAVWYSQWKEYGKPRNNTPTNIMNKELKTLPLLLFQFLLSRSLNLDHSKYKRSLDVVILIIVLYHSLNIIITQIHSDNSNTLPSPPCLL
jgi:hypothetical protein